MLEAFVGVVLFVSGVFAGAGLVLVTAFRYAANHAKEAAKAKNETLAALMKARQGGGGKKPPLRAVPSKLQQWACPDCGYTWAAMEIGSECPKCGVQIA